MSEEMLVVKYPSERRPALVLTNEEGSVNIAFNHTASALAPEQLEEAWKAMDQMFRGNYPGAEWFRSEITEIKGRPWFVLELRTPAADTDIRNLMLGTSLDGRLLIVAVNMTKGLEQEWLPLAQQIVESIEITD